MRFGVLNAAPESSFCTLLAGGEDGLYLICSYSLLQMARPGGPHE